VLAARRVIVEVFKQAALCSQTRRRWTGSSAALRAQFRTRH
jgi:hypothetical protein